MDGCLIRAPPPLVVHSKSVSLFVNSPPTIPFQVAGRSGPHSRIQWDIGHRTNWIKKRLQFPRGRRHAYAETRKDTTVTITFCLLPIGVCLSESCGIPFLVIIAPCFLPGAQQISACVCVHSIYVRRNWPPPSVICFIFSSLMPSLSRLLAQ
ncbi:hypothetical protein BC832DRAFT_388807 [Gaertneriomyces semiglobifer]|nr:hypothetical protein BC832DRAFT_388807 [Gaertneriomyces semiglobifer]